MLLTCILAFHFLPLPAIWPQMPSSPSNWLFPDGNPEGTLYNIQPSNPQDLNGITVKWSTPAISGDVKPLIGNLISNDKIMNGFQFAPNEIAAVVGGKIIIVDAAGNVWSRTQLPPYIQNLSVLFDTTQTGLTTNTGNPLVMGLETIEYENMSDSLAFAYVAGFDHPADTTAILKRLAVDLRDYSPNISASIKPVFGKRDGDNILIYATINMVSPLVEDPPPIDPAFLRGFTVFNARVGQGSYPIPDVGDIIDSRLHLAPNVSPNQPSFSLHGSAKIASLLPVYPDMNTSYGIDDPFFGQTTYSDKPYLIGTDISSGLINYDILPTDLTTAIPIEAKRPYIRPYYIHLNDAGPGTDSIYILLSEGYMGIDSSHGTPRLHLLRSDGSFITYYDDPFSPSYAGTEDHLWSVAAGNVDGNASNQWQPYYPNNPGSEIIVTQSSRDFAVAGNKLTILRYNSGTVPKPSPPGTELFPFDTICTQRMNGWVGAVNDLDRHPDGKDEIIMVDGATIRILKMRDYQDFLFKTGRPFDTLFTHTFKNETISSVAAADVEGDGLNDIVVTTYDSTYVIGSLIRNILEITQPVTEMSPPQEYCAGDTVKIRWVNRMKGQDKVNIHYYVYLNNNRTGEIVPIDSNITNKSDTVEYLYVVDNEVIGTDGRFIVESSYYPSVIFDSTAILRLNNPFLVVDSLSTKTYMPGDMINFTGRVACVDSVAIEFQPDSAVWQRVWSEPINFDWTYNISAEIPCLDFFSCAGADRDSILETRVVAFKEQWADTSNIFDLRILPKPFPVVFDTCESNCPTITFRWNPMAFEYNCENVNISLAPDASSSFSLLESVPLDDEAYVWEVPLNMPDSVVMRFCCESSCIRTDTTIRAYKPAYIQIVSPNPFNPPLEEVEITYNVPSETNVTIKILDQANRFVAQPVTAQRRLPNIAYCDRWNGIIWDGSTAQNGMYYLCLEMSNGIKEVYPIFVRK